MVNPLPTCWEPIGQQFWVMTFFNLTLNGMGLRNLMRRRQDFDPVLAPAGAVAVILAGGMGTRMRTSVPKQLLHLAGEPILQRTLRKFAHADRFDAVAVVANVEWYDTIAQIAKHALGERIQFFLVEGGESRNESVLNALQMFSAQDNVRCLVHDGVRPLVTDNLLNAVLDALSSSRAVVPVIDAVDPLFRVVDGTVKRVEARNEVFRGQTPQGFWLQELRLALLRLGPEVIGRYSTLYEVLQLIHPDIKISCIAGEPDNLKITQPVDLLTAEQIFRERAPELSLSLGRREPS